MTDIKKRAIDYTAIDKLVEAIREASSETLIIVDFDETLLLRNSTAEYLNSLQPRVIGFLILRILEFLKPWHLISNLEKRDKAKDWFLIFVTTLLLPWNLILWHVKAAKFAKEYGNKELVRELNKHNSNSVAIASLGFKFIIDPILRQIPLEYSHSIGCSFWNGLRDRQKNKLTLVTETIDSDRISSAIAITDSQDDLPLLEKTARPFLIKWSNSQYTLPMKDIYLPMMYIHKVKRVNQNYIVDLILLDDFPLLVITFSWLSQFPILNALGIFCLLFSFWCIYEYGYYENDLIAEKYERNPVLKHTYYEHLVNIKPWQPWIWSLTTGLLGAFLVVSSNAIAPYPEFSLLEINKSFSLFHLIEVTNSYGELVATSLRAFYIWFCFLIVSRFAFLIYNHVNKPTRIWLYPLLQSFRYCGFLVITKTNLVGGCILISQITARSINYIIYRYSGGKPGSWPKFPDWFFRLLLFSLFIVVFSLVESDLALLFNWQTSILALWWFKKCRKQAMTIASEVQPICGEKTQEQYHHRQYQVKQQ